MASTEFEIRKLKRKIQKLELIASNAVIAVYLFSVGAHEEFNEQFSANEKLAKAEKLIINGVKERKQHLELLLPDKPAASLAHSVDYNTCNNPICALGKMVTEDDGIRILSDYVDEIMAQEKESKE